MKLKPGLWDFTPGNETGLLHSSQSIVTVSYSYKLIFAYLRITPWLS